MTEEYKTNLLDYVVGNLNNGTGNDNLTISDNILLASSGSPSSNSIKLKDSNGNYNGLLLSNFLNEINGYQIYNYDGSLVATITKYSSGVDIDNFEYIYVEDDGTLLVITRYNSGTYPRRLLMLNNPSVKNNQGQYELKIKKSYNITDYLPDNYTIWNIQKSPNESLYAVSIQNQYTEGKILKTNNGLLSCKIQVGAENEYKTYYGGLITNSTLIPYNDSEVKFNSDGEIDYKVVLTNSYSLAENNNLVVYHKGYEDDTLTLLGTVELTEDKTAETIIYNDNILGILQIENNSVITSYYAKFDIKNNSYTIIDELCKSQLNNFSSKFITNNLIILPFYDANKNKSFIYVYEGDKLLSIKEYETGYTAVSDFINHIVVNTYNLYNIISYLGSSAIINQFTYNVNNYSGDDYISETMFVPNSAILSDNEKILFARNLYNRILQQTTITSTIQIPNRYLNEDNITNEKLIGKNNNIIDNNNINISKNIYEEVLVNFNDTINIVDNNEEKNIINQNGSIQLCNSLLSGNSYDNKKMTKYRIVFIDDSVKIGSLSNPVKINDNIYEFTILVGSLNTSGVNRLEFISEDETLTYLTITPTIEANKIYKIKQKVRVI